MGKPSEKWETAVITGDDVREWLNKEICFGTCDRYGYDAEGREGEYLQALANTGPLIPENTLFDRIQFQNVYGISINKRGFGSYVDGQGTIIKRYMHGTRPNGRIIGVIEEENDDGSLQIKLYGNNIQFDVGALYDLQLVYFMNVHVPYDADEDKIAVMPNLLSWDVSTSIVNNTMAIWENYEESVSSGYDAKIDPDMITDRYVSTYGSAFFQYHCEQSGQMFGRRGIMNITKDDSTTVTIGKPQNSRAQNLLLYPDMSLGLIDNAVEGNLFDLMLDAYWKSLSTYSNIKLGDGSLPEGIIYLYDFQSSDMIDLFGYAQYYKLFNIPLTHSKAQALRYIENDVLPDDVFLYPFDFDALPMTDGIPPTGSGDTPDPDKENGDDGINGIPTEDANPAITPNMLANNNYYWLQAGQLESFITWFWQNAGQIIDVNDLWEKVQGLYQNLAQAVVNIRFFPVDVNYIGGTEDTDHINIGQINMPFAGIKQLKKRKLTKRVLGRYNIEKYYKAFTDYSPYTELQLYLPFHGWLSLDIDIFMGNQLEVRCIYDHIGGTIQYGVYVISKGKEYLVNTCIAKMAIDIPITLQSKSDRDSAIFTNVTSAMGSLLGAGLSATTGNPIGLVMSTTNAISSGVQSAPFKMYGTQGESGSYFLPNKCAVYIKRPSYNRPTNYASRVGYPCNLGGKLSSFSGLTMVYNPRITFSGNVYTDPDTHTQVTMKPLKEEIDEIYNYLEKGVIL